MDRVIVHNISNRDYVPVNATAITIGHIKIRPGKHAFVPVASINTKAEQLHGKLIWIGSLPSSLLKSNKKSSAPASSMGREEAKSFLSTEPLENLKNMLNGVTPKIEIASSAPHRRYVYSTLAACFSDKYDLDPERFFWLGRWKKLSNGDYIEA